MRNVLLERGLPVPHRLGRRRHHDGAAARPSDRVLRVRDGPVVAADAQRPDGRGRRVEVLPREERLHRLHVVDEDHVRRDPHHGSVLRQETVGFEGQPAVPALPADPEGARGWKPGAWDLGEDV